MAWRFFLGFERFGPVCGVQDASRSRTDARPARQRARLALCRRLAPRRGAPPAGAAFGRPLWASAAAAERRADPAGGAMEIWLQIDQVDHQDALCRKAAAPQLE